MSNSCEKGSCHWMAQRVTALALIPLVIWAIYSVLSNIGASHEEFTTWLSSKTNATLMILFIIFSFYHAVLGAQVIVEDYIHCEWFKKLKIVGNKIFFSVLGVVCIYSILKISFGA